MTKLEHERKARKMSQAALGLATKMTQPMISQIERGRLVPTPEELGRLAACLGVPQDELLTNAEAGPIRRFLQRLS